MASVRENSDKAGGVASCEPSSTATSLHAAAVEGDKESAFALLVKGADVNARDGDGKTPLFLAVERGHLELARYLTYQGADVSIPAGSGTTPLHAAVQSGDVRALKLLVFREGVNLESRDELAQTALHAAACAGNVEMVAILVNRGAELEAKDAQNKTPLVLAVERGDTQTAQKLISKGAKLDSKDAQNRTPLELAIERGDARAAQKLIDKGADLFDPDGDPMEQREELRKQMLDSPIAHIVNQRLVALESAYNIPEVYSYPKRVSFLWTNVCNARCIFCGYRPVPKSKSFYLTLEDVKKRTWLKYASILNCGAGASDPLAHPEYLPIFRYIIETYPHLQIRMITNGIGLTEEICEGFCGNLFHLNVSLNSSRKDSWRKTTRAKGFDNILAMISYLARLKEINNTSEPRIQLSMAVHEENTDEVLEFVQLAKQIGANEVLFRNVRLNLDTKDRLRSPYDRQKQTNDLYEEADRQAEALGLRLVHPPLFSEESQISQGKRVGGTVKACFDPWANCTIRTRGLERFCCFGVDLFVPCDVHNLTDDHFHNQVWNHPTAQFFRKTINIRGRNPVCDTCYNLDRFDPASLQRKTRLKELVHPLLRGVNPDTPVEEIENRMQEVTKLL